MSTEQLTTLARPYALAAFENALAHEDLASWGNMLQSAAMIAENPAIAKLFNSPHVAPEQLSDLFCDILSKLLDTEKKNFIHLLAEYQRLEALPEIAELFHKYKADYEKTMDVQLTSAIPLEEEYRQKFTDALTRRLKRKIALECTVDPTLLGGAIIRAGDLVIDGSIRGKLNRLIEFI